MLMAAWFVGTKDSQGYFVSGGSGRLARQIIEHLLDANIGPIITISRSPEKLDDLAKRGVIVRKASFDSPLSELAEALKGVNRALFISTDDIGRRSEQIAHAVNAAKLAGVEHLLYTSCTSPNPDKQSLIPSDHFWFEQALINSGLGFTILRHNMYSEHLFLSLPIAVKTGKLRASIGKGARAYVTRADCARADAFALMSNKKERAIYDISGPEALNMDEIIDIVYDLIGIEISHEVIKDEIVLSELLAENLPLDMAEGVVEFDRAARNGNHAILSDAVERLTGQAPESVKSYLARHIDVLKSGKINIDV